MPHGYFAILALALSSALAGCSTPVVNLAPQRPTAELAMIHTTFAPGLEGVDGQPCKSGHGFGGNKVWLAPGEHDLYVRRVITSHAWTRYIWWNVRAKVEAGKTYKIDQPWSDNTLSTLRMRCIETDETVPLQPVPMQKPIKDPMG